MKNWFTPNTEDIHRCMRIANRWLQDYPEYQLRYKIDMQNSRITLYNRIERLSKIQPVVVDLDVLKTYLNNYVDEVKDNNRSFSPFEFFDKYGCGLPDVEMWEIKND